jgi:PAS domain S-box-containing protein
VTRRTTEGDELSPRSTAEHSASLLLADADRLGRARRLAPAVGRSAALDRLADVAARLLGTASSHVSLLTDVHVVAGGTGLLGRGMGDDDPLAESLCTVAAVAPEGLVVSDTVHDERVRDLPPVVTGEVGAYLGVPLATEDGTVVGVLCVSDPAPRQWSDDDVRVMGRLAASAVAELELSVLSEEYEASQVRFALAVEAAGIGSFEWHLDTGRLVWDDRLIELFGYDRDEFDENIQSFSARVHPDDLPKVWQVLRRAEETGGTFDMEYRIMREDGLTRWVAARGRALVDESGRATRLLGAAYDNTGARESEARVARVLETMSAAFYSLDREWRFTYVNAEAERLLGRGRGELLGGVVWDLYPATPGTGFDREFRRAVCTGEPVTFEEYYPAPLDRWYELRAWPTPDGLSVYFLDVTERRALLQQTERAAARAALLASVTTQLTGTLDAEEAVARLAQLVVPMLADWCLVTLVGGTSGREELRDVGWWHRDPAQRAATEEYGRLRLRSLRPTAYVREVLRTGKPFVLPREATPGIAAVLRPGRASEVLEQLAPSAGAILPLAGRGRITGLLSIFRGPDAEPFTDDDLGTALEVASRAGLALDNALLYAQQVRLAGDLQRSLLTAPPEPDHVEIAVRYATAAEAAQVGGDWYDAFLQPDGATVLVIGDVVGHDSAATAAMGQLRGLLRGISFSSGSGPAASLQGLDAAMQVGTFATAVVARLEQSDEERERGVSRVRWSNAGHPPPMVLDGHGGVAVLADMTADLLLGIDPGTERRESEISLDRGATLLLYTDGLVERRGQNLDEGIARLRSLLQELGDLPLDQLCDQLLTRLLPARAEDDVALVAVRLHPQDRPRPPEAGPNRVPPEVDDRPGSS